MAAIEEIEARRAERKQKQDADRREQETKDLEAIDALEAVSGEPLLTMTASSFKPGAAVRIAFRSPTPIEYRRYCDMVGKSTQKGDARARREAQEMLAAACLEYPAKDSDTHKATLEAFPGLLLSLAIEAAKVAELNREEEGKG